MQRACAATQGSICLFRGDFLTVSKRQIPLDLMSSSVQRSLWIPLTSVLKAFSTLLVFNCLPFKNLQRKIRIHKRGGGQGLSPPPAQHVESCGPWSKWSDPGLLISFSVRESTSQWAQPFPSIHQTRALLSSMHLYLWVPLLLFLLVIVPIFSRYCPWLPLSPDVSRLAFAVCLPCSLEWPF